MNQYKLRTTCPKCQGDGEYLHEIIIEGEEQEIMLPCEACDAVGYFIWGSIDGAVEIDWIIKKIKKILIKLDLPED